MNALAGCDWCGVLAVARCQECGRAHCQSHGLPLWRSEAPLCNQCIADHATAEQRAEADVRQAAHLLALELRKHDVRPGAEGRQRDKKRGQTTHGWVLTEFRKDESRYDPSDTPGVLLTTEGELLEFSRDGSRRGRITLEGRARLTMFLPSRDDIRAAMRTLAQQHGLA
jgi:hypothetical protein